MVDLGRHRSLRSLQASLPKLVDPRQKLDEKSVRLLAGVSVAEFGDAVAPSNGEIRWWMPMPFVG